MALSYKFRRRLSVLLLLIWLPVYVVVVVTVMNRIGPLPAWAQLLSYPVLGVAWALPFRKVFRGVGKADPEAERED